MTAKKGKAATVVSNLWRRADGKGLSSSSKQADGRFHAPTLRSPLALATEDLNSTCPKRCKVTAGPWRFQRIFQPAQRRPWRREDVPGRQRNSFPSVDPVRESTAYCFQGDHNSPANLEPFPREHDRSRLFSGNQVAPRSGARAAGAFSTRPRAASSTYAVAVIPVHLDAHPVSLADS